MGVWTIIVAAGAGARFGGPKLLEKLAGQRVLDHSVSGALAASDGVVVVLASDRLDELGPSLMVRGCLVTAGGATRSSSVRAGLAAIPEPARTVVVHDGARPLAGVDIYGRVIAAVEAGADAAVPVIPLVDTIRQVDGGVVDRQALRAVQTPQAFRPDVLARAHESDAEATDDAGLVEAIGGKVVLVDGSPRNIKITDPMDLEIARALVDQ
jgi:2-C-methyl-D-erythritol 4-phosphate cytidylyltransferase